MTPDDARRVVEEVRALRALREWVDRRDADAEVDVMYDDGAHRPGGDA